MSLLCALILYASPSFAQSYDFPTHVQRYIVGVETGLELSRALTTDESEQNSVKDKMRSLLRGQAEAAFDAKLIATLEAISAAPIPDVEKMSLFKNLHIALKHHALTLTKSQADHVGAASIAIGSAIGLIGAMIYFDHGVARDAFSMMFEGFGFVMKYGVFIGGGAALGATAGSIALPYLPGRSVPDGALEKIDEVCAALLAPKEN